MLVSIIVLSGIFFQYSVITGDCFGDQSSSKNDCYDSIIISFDGGTLFFFRTGNYTRCYLSVPPNSDSVYSEKD